MDLMRERRYLLDKAVANALQHFDGTRYTLHTWCVMPNHVHVLMQINDDLPRIGHSWKSYTAHVAGIEWQREYYDHLVRDQREFGRTAEYICANPAAAGLRNWPWVSRNPW